MKDDAPLTPLGSFSVPFQRWARPSPAISVFTAFVRSQQGEETPDADLLHDAWNGLQAALGGELKRRGLWHSPPCYLGVYGYDRWDAEETVGDPMSYAWCHTRPTQSALAELVTDCWAFIFSARMQSLKAQLTDKENIDGLVLRNVKNFLHERQREHDPVGYRVFERLKGALADAVSRQAVYVLGGDPRIRNNTVIGFEPATELRLTALDLGPIVVRWNDKLLPGLVTARGREETAVLKRLDQLLLEAVRSCDQLDEFGIGLCRTPVPDRPVDVHCHSQAGRPQGAMAPLHRTTRIDELLLAQLRVLETLTPEGFLEFRDPLKPASGLQSGQFRAIEILGGLDGSLPADASPLSEHDREELRRRAGLATLFTALCASLRAHGFDAPDGDGTKLRERRLDALATLYRDHATPERAVLHRVCELLLDHDEAISRWRFQHSLMAAREIGSRPGTGGGGVAYLDTTIGLRFFPELWEVRNRL